MAEKKAGWVDTCERFVAFLDIMGFKDRLQRDGHDKVMEMLKYLRTTIKVFDDLTRNKLEVERLKGLLEEDYTPDNSLVFLVTFSDSIILISRNESKESLYELLDYTNIIFFEAIRNGIPMKGAIAYGKMTVDRDDSLYFGQPLIDAYELQKALQLYGVALHHTVEKFLSESNITLNSENFDFFQYPIPMKSGKITHYTLDWTGDLFTNLDEFTVNEIPNVISVFASKLYNNVSGNPRKYIDNTIEFIREISEKKLKLKQEKKT